MGDDSARRLGRVAGLRGFAFVGRERERAGLVGALSARPAVALVQGEAGVGKSRLVAEAVAVLRAQGVGVVARSCHPLREPLAFGPVIDALNGVGEYLRPQAWMDRALAILDRIDDPETAAVVHVNRLVMLPTCADPAIPELIAALPRRTENPRLLFTTMIGLSNAAEIAYCVGLDRRVIGWTEEAIAIGERTELTGLLMFCRSYPLLLDWAAGHWQDFETALAGYRADFPESPLADAGLLAAAQGVVFAARGHGARAVDRFERALTEEADSVLSLPSAAGLARHHLGRGDPDSAWRVLTPAVRLMRRRGAWPFAFDLLPAAVETALQRFDRPTATALLKDHEAGIAGLECPGAVAEHSFCRGLLLGADQPAEAVAAFELARDQWHEIGRPYPAALATERAALASRDDPAAGAAGLGAAIDVFDRLGAVTDGSRCRHHLRGLDHGRAAPLGPRTPDSDLSARERQVADLLAEGASNKEIAAALYVSPRTAEHHVAAVLHKLGTTRQALRRSDGRR